MTNQPEDVWVVFKMTRAEAEAARDRDAPAGIRAAASHVIGRGIRRALTGEAGAWEGVEGPPVRGLSGVTYRGAMESHRGELFHGERRVLVIPLPEER